MPMVLPYPFLTSLALFLTISVSDPLTAQKPADLNRTLRVTQPMFLEIALWGGDVTVVQGPPDRVTISVARSDGASTVSGLESLVSIEQNGSHVRIENAKQLSKEDASRIKIFYRIEVPQRTQVSSSLGRGKLTILGIDGPIQASVETGNIDISYVIGEVSAHSEVGDIGIVSVAGQVKVATGTGNITCERVPGGILAEAGDGDITLTVVGPAEARVRRGAGRIDVSGARGTLLATTQDGDLHVKAVPHQEWELSSVSGNIRIELPPAAGFQVDALTNSGTITVARADMGESSGIGHQLNQTINGGGHRIEVRTEKGNVLFK